MAMLSPMGRVPRRRPSRRRGDRRLRPFVIFVVLSSSLATVIWYEALRPHDNDTAASAACAQHPATLDGSEAPTHQLRVRVYNASQKTGLAKAISDQLTKHGFTVEVQGNDPLTSRKVEGVGEIRYGEFGTDTANAVREVIPGAEPRLDARTDNIVDLALGPKFTKLNIDETQLNRPNTPAISQPSGATISPANDDKC